MRLRRHQPFLLRERQVLGARAEAGYSLLGHQRPKGVGARRERRPVVQHDGRMHRQGAHEPVPHHPPTRGDVAEPVLLFEIDVQHVLLLVLQQRPPGTMHHAFGEPGGARRVEDVGRMVEWEALEPEAGIAGQRARPLVPQHGARNGRDRGSFREVRNDDDLFDRREAAGDVGDAPQAVDFLSGVATPVGTEQDARRDLAEAVHHARHAEVRRAGRPDGAEARGSEHRDHRLGDVRQEPRHPISRPNARRPERGRDTGGLVVECAVAQLAPCPGLVPCHERRVRVTLPQQVLGEVESRAGEPAWPPDRIGRGHAVQSHAHVVCWLRGDHSAEAPHGGPEPLRGRDRPAVQRAIVGDVRSILTADGRNEGGQVGAGHPVRRRRPERELR